MNKRLLAVAVAAACAPAGARSANDQPEVIKTTVDVKIEAQAVVGAPVGHLVIEALREFINACPSTPTGKFESRAGLDVSWETKSERA